MLLESPQWGDSNEYTPHIIPIFYCRLKYNPDFASKSGAINNSHWLKQSLSPTSFHGPEGVQTIKYGCIWALP